MDLKEYRKEIDQIDQKILHALLHRIKLCQKIAKHKKRLNLPMMQPDRVECVLANVVSEAKHLGIRPEFAKQLYALIHQEMFSLEDAIIDSA